MSSVELFYCSKCQKGLPLTSFGKDTYQLSGISRWCKNCKYGKTAKYRASMREQVLEGYGAWCNCCGETEKVFLTLDHVDNNGAEERKALTPLTRNNDGVFAKAIKENFPLCYQILCNNCNIAKYRVGECPHKQVGFEVIDTAKLLVACPL